MSTSSIGEPNSVFIPQNLDELLEAGIKFGGVVMLGPALAQRMVDSLSGNTIEQVNLELETVSITNYCKFTLEVGFSLLREYFGRYYTTIFFYGPVIERLIELFGVDPKQDPYYKVN